MKLFAPKPLAVWAFTLCTLPLPGAQTGQVGSKVCGTCHADIFRRYSATPMAVSSGLAAAIPLSGKTSFADNSGFHYSLVQQTGKLFLDFRQANASPGERRELKYFVGSGAAARSYLIDVGNFLYEAPATYYSGPRAWDLSPGYRRYSYPFLTRAIAPGCLECHATGVQPLPGTQNGYLSPPFLEAGVGCERCHGPGTRHAASGNPKDIVNPASLGPEARAGVCAQCHLSGEIRVDRAGKSISDFTAGDKLSDYSVAFVRAGLSRGMKVTSHVENLSQSACARASGDRLWCGTCHDPHTVPAAAEKAGWYRAKCLTCHAPAECRRGDNCVACHMPTSPVTDAEHVVYTDHSIPRRAVPRNQSPPGDAPILAFGGAPSDPRDLGLAYAILALREQNAAYRTRAFDLLQTAERRHPDDAQTLSYLADLYKTRKDDQAAEQRYRRLYTVDPSQSSAPMNLGAYEMQAGHFEQAIPLFRQALAISPGLVLVRLDLAVALIRTGQKVEARSVLEKALEFNPSFSAARDLLKQIQ